MKLCKTIGLCSLLSAITGLGAPEEGKKSPPVLIGTIGSVDKEKGLITLTIGETGSVVRLRLTDPVLVGRLKTSDKVLINPEGKTVGAIVTVPLELVDSELPTKGEASGAPAELVLLDMLQRERDEAKEAICRSNLRQISTALRMYAMDNDGRFPPDLGPLVEGEIENPAVFLCASKAQMAPKDFEKLDSEQKMKWVRENTAYAYNGAGKTDGDRDHATSVLVYDKAGSHRGKNVLAVFGDGHFEILPPEKWAALVKEDPALKKEVR